ncbi:hypothetical protein SEPCBS57363_005189 [Sporothrix epigloea]|uniref:Metallo-beta-lactamase domain-containing protein n=1 Tax=Sporothrix epigloea TaxID=1892477 RepID=A0ABP0E020_9PEZI
MASQLVALPEIERLSPACVRILGGNPGKFTLQGTNTYLVGTGRDRILIDTAEGAATWVDALKRTLDDEDATLSAALITHWHADHVGGIGQLRRLFSDIAVYQSQIAQHSFAPSAVGRGIQDIVDGDTFSVEGATLRAVHTPGHTTDHMAFVLEQEGSIFAGDNVLGQGTAVFEDLAVYLQSLARMQALYDKGDKGGRLLYPGHGPIVKDGPAKIAEYIQHRQQREDQVTQLLLTSDKIETPICPTDCGKPTTWTAMELVEVIYADVRRDLYPAAERGIIQILEKLEGEGKVVRDGHLWARHERSSL